MIGHGFHSEVDWFLGQFPDYPVEHEQIVFAHFLEIRGLKFLIDFGFENAESKTWELLDGEELQ